MSSPTGIDLSTEYLGLPLHHPLMPGASPLVDDLDTVRQLEDVGAAAIVMHSLFEEQITGEQLATHAYLEHPAEAFAEALSYLPSPDAFVLGPEEYLEQLRRIKAAVQLPVITSLNGTTEGGWLEYAGLMAEAGADAIELNVYEVASDPAISATQLENRTVAMVRAVKQSLPIPVAVKLSPFYTSLAHFAHRLDRAGADGLVLFNRFYQADIDIEELELERSLRYSSSSELLLRLRWLAILAPKTQASLAVTGGVHNVVDVVKAVMSGADAVQVVSVLLERGLGTFETLRRGLSRWLEEHEYESLSQMKASMSTASCPDPHAYERANYIKVLQRAASRF